MNTYLVRQELGNILKNAMKSVVKRAVAVAVECSVNYKEAQKIIGIKLHNRKLIGIICVIIPLFMRVVLYRRIFVS